MTDPAGGGATPPPPSDWGSQPQGTGAATPAGFQVAPVAAGPAPGVAYADLVTRIIAYIIDAILLSVATFIIAAILGGIFITFGGLVGLLVGLVVIGGLVLFGSAFYFIYTWTTMRASPGQKVLNLETVNAADGATLTRDQAIKRWAYLYGLFSLATVAQFVLSASSLAILSSLLSLATLVYAIYLLYSASQDAKRQGFHDKQAGTVVVKRGG
jgi:uncharacterized RDD family membrane protein YckC